MPLAATTSNTGPFAGRDPATLSLHAGKLRGEDGTSEDAARRASSVSPAARWKPMPRTSRRAWKPDSVGKLYSGQMAISRGTSRKDLTTYAFGAQFVEVRVHARTREIRVPRAW